MADPNMTSVPVKIDASALAEALSKAQQQSAQNVEYIEPAPFISGAGTRMGKLYERYLLLNEIATRLNGKKLSDPLPDTIRISKVSISFTTERGHTPADTRTADIFNVACVGDIVPLLSTELGAIIYSIEQEAKSVVEIATKTTETCTKARTDWEAANPDRKIVRTDLVGATGAPVLGSVADPQIVVEPTKSPLPDNEN